MKENIKYVKLELSEELYQRIKVYGRLRSLSVPGVIKAVLWDTIKAEDMMKEFATEFKEVFEKVAPEFIEKAGAEWKARQNSKPARARKAQRKPAR